jgi:uncharacterized membrane protein (UPF0127 family)
MKNATKKIVSAKPVKKTSAARIKRVAQLAYVMEMATGNASDADVMVAAFMILEDRKRRIGEGQ